jgi:hypothetical protein
MFKSHRLRALGWLGWGIVLACLGLTTGIAAEPGATISPEQERLFEEKVRPLLVANCQECHGSKKQESGLRLDSRQAMLSGGESGERAIVPGDPDRSLLVKAINHVGDYQMPPKRKMADDEIAILADWVRQGALWPESSSTSEPTKSVSELAIDHRRSHWAYQPPVRSPLPKLKDGARAANRIDLFILARLDAAGLSMSLEADRRTLIRRLTYDLIGLPPAPEEVEAFTTDKAPDAYERLVDRLLASPHYGERWGRHWLDVARYGDTKGYAFQQERRYPYAYTYRDYVFRAFNADLPYDDFIREQLAADKLPASEQDKSKLAALGFLTTGRKFNNRNDDIDDQIDVVSRGLLGITVACARCHDHKYDAIPTEDYYSLYGVFASCAEPAELPLLASPQTSEGLEKSEDYRKYEEQLAKLRDEFEKFATKKHEETMEQARHQAADYLARLAAGESDALAAKLPFMSLDPKDLRRGLIEKWRRYVDERARPDDPVFGIWHDLMKLPGDGFAEKASAVIDRWIALPAGQSAGQCNPLVQKAFAEDRPAARIDVARIYGKLLTDALEAQKQATTAETTLELSVATKQATDVLLAADSPTTFDRGDLRQYLNRSDRNKFSELQKKIDSHQANSPFAPPRAMVVADNPKPTEPRVLVRGNPARPGKPVPRQFLLVVAGEQRQPFGNSSGGRLELAEAIAAADNPLTRRVIANRLWMHHFGEPLAASPSDFGIRAEPPTHPEVLDELATLLLDRGWSLKALHREIMISSAYRQASLDRPDCRAIDPENRLLWRMNRRRLELEAMRDTLLAVADRLDETMYGRAAELTKPPFAKRRAVYGFIDRQDLPNWFRVFDIASPDQSSPRRPRTTVPQQALFFMNSPFVVEQAQALAARSEIQSEECDECRLTALYRLVLSRAPDQDELEVGLEFLTDASASSEVKLSPLEQFAQLLLLSNELMYID